jgi:thioredoxin 2
MHGMDKAAHVICPHCDTINRVPQAKLDAGGKCGNCHKPLLEARPVALDQARFDRHLQKGDVPLLVDFWAPWCGPCKAMAPEFERAAGRLEPNLRLVKVNVDEEPALAQRYGIQSIPTLAVFRHGKELARQAGAMSAADLERWVASVRA